MTDSHESLEFVQLTDLHIEEVGSRHWGLDTHDSFKRTLKYVLDQHPALNFIVLTGDLVDKPTTSAYRRVADLLRDCPIPVYRIPGNHDDSAMLYAELGDTPFKRDKVIRHGKWQIILLDSSGEDHHKGWLSEAELGHLGGSLDSGADHAMVLVHHHPLPIGSAWMDAMGLVNGEALRDMLKRHGGRVKAVAFGHVHQAFEAEHENIPYFGAPSTCVQFVPAQDRFTKSSSPPGYRWFSLNRNGQVQTRVHYLEDAPAQTSESRNAAALAR